MKKIKHMHQLRAEKKRIGDAEAELNRKISENWKQLKESIKPLNLAKDTYNNFLEKKTHTPHSEDGIFRNTVTYGLNYLSGKLAAMAEEKMNRIFRKKQ